MVDLGFLEKFTKGDTQKMQRYIKLYLDVAPQTFADMKQNLKDKDWEQLRINAHSLKPQAEFMGILSLKDALATIEEAVHNKTINNIIDNFNAANTHYLNSTKLLKDILVKLNKNE
ncbi:Hpt domain-containing protein [Subsaxibacter sp. CAU 1640]|uniref:Hpt domain-containing protein n=1 Tax=Subsaxibacter sp. CAU 1640 TaxID=2933271 RepID=UPI0020051397|nr:Hpt domain-containing protein [Subsaxibacter sp. CAU 1640]MCK7590548.1 Hpt domain-containing protein [Subsaxibacter sp. CAU 1640]